MKQSEFSESVVLFRTSQAIEVRASLLRLDRYAASFEIYSPDTVMQTSEALEDFKIFINDRPVYVGRAVVRDLVNTGTVVVCEVDLDDFCFDVEFHATVSEQTQLRAQFEEFAQQWQKVCKVLPEFKVAIADIQTFLIDLRRWLEQVELSIRSSPKADGPQFVRAVIENLSQQVIPIIDALFEKFEHVTSNLEHEMRPVHRSYIQRHLHPIVLCAPFAYRTYRKPLGYAGDYEMVNMMLRDPQEGSSIFAKMFNVWLLHQSSAAAHRSRLDFLKQRLIEETAAAVRAGREARIFNLGCGPAWEVQAFLADSQLSNHAQFTLLDFNDETVQHTTQVLQQKKRQHQRTTLITLIKKSVQQLLKDIVRTDELSATTKYDLIYCSGLFDYLPDRTCKRLMTVFYKSLAPGGVVLATNVAPSTPNRGSLELILDWHLIYRDVKSFETLIPDGVPREQVQLRCDETAVNLFLEARKTNAF